VRSLQPGKIQRWELTNSRTRRAGAGFLVTYFAKDAARLL